MRRQYAFISVFKIYFIKACIYSQAISKACIYFRTVVLDKSLDCCRPNLLHLSGKEVLSDKRIKISFV